MTEKILKNDDEWRQQLSPDQFRICRKGGRNQHLVEIIGTLKKSVPTSVYAAVMNCLIQAQNLILAQAGQAFIKP